MSAGTSVKSKRDGGDGSARQLAAEGSVEQEADERQDRDEPEQVGFMGRGLDVSGVVLKADPLSGMTERQGKGRLVI